MVRGRLSAAETVEETDAQLQVPRLPVRFEPRCLQCAGMRQTKIRDPGDVFPDVKAKAGLLSGSDLHSAAHDPRYLPSISQIQSKS